MAKVILYIFLAVSVHCGTGALANAIPSAGTKFEETMVKTSVILGQFTMPALFIGLAYRKFRKI